MKINKIILGFLAFAALNSSQCNSINGKISTGLKMIGGISTIAVTGFILKMTQNINKSLTTIKNNNESEHAKLVHNTSLATAVWIVSMSAYVLLKN